MTLQVPYLADEAIERDAEALLAQFAHARGMAIRAPIPIEDIIEKHLKLHIEFDDLHHLLGVPRGGSGTADIFGAIWFETGEIVIDESLDPEERPPIEGRYRFTLAHDGGHWRLHRPLVQANSGHGSLFGYARQPTVVCRSSRAKDRAEFQANLYASCLLMPRKLVFQAWRDRFGNDHPWGVPRKDGIVDVDEIIRMLPNSGAVPVVISHYFDQFCDDQLLEHIARPFAEQFLVSPIAMRIRLERLDLLHRAVPRQQSLLVRS
jgi:Zn-dependent peptidase ImmA (M78 family)